MSLSFSQPLALEIKEERVFIGCNKNFEEKEDYKTNSKRLTMRKNRTMTKKKENPGAKILEGGGDYKDKDSWPRISSSCNSSRLSMVSDLKGVNVRSSKDAVKCCGQCDLVRMNNSSVMGFKQRLVFSTVFLLVSTHLMLLVTNTIQTVGANPAVGSPPLHVSTTTGKTSNYIDDLNNGLVKCLNN